MSSIYEQHQCRPERCNPQSEEMLIERRQLQSPALTTNVFLCKYGCAHICSQDDCHLYHATESGTCPVSSFQFGTKVSAYSKDDYRTWKNPHAEHQAEPILSTQWLLNPVNEQLEAAPIVVALPNKRRLTARHLSVEETERRAGAVVKQLLYSRDRRALIQSFVSRQMQQGRDAQANYCRDQRNAQQLPFLSDMYRIAANYTRQEIRLHEFDFNKATFEYYIFVLLHVWDVLQRFHVPMNEKQYTALDEEIVPRLDFEAVCLGALYGMRKGISRGSLELLPADDFLLQHLPTINELSNFNMEKSHVTKGERLICDAYDNALREHAAHSEFMLDMDKMPKSNETVVKAHETDPALVVKITSSGEELFMPVSRKKKQKPS